MNKVKVIALLCTLALLLTLAGCGAMSKQKTAITEAIASYSDAHIVVDDLNAQLRELTRGTTGYEDKASYTLNVQLPNYALVDISSLEYETPPVDYANPDSDAYLEDLLIAIRQSIDTAALVQQPNGTVPAEITVNLSLVENDWVAELSAASMQEIQAQADKMMRNNLSDPRNLPPEYSYVRIAEQKAALFDALVRGSSYIDAIAITSVEALSGNEYRLNVSYPDPEAFFQALGDRYVDSFTELVFGSVSCTLNPNDFDSLDAKPAMKSGSITVSLESDGTCAVVNGDEFALEFSGARTQAETMAAKSVSEKWGVPEQARPTENTLLYTRGFGGSEFRTWLTDEAVESYIRLYRVESSTEEAGSLQAGAYVLSNNKMMKISLPPGTYKVVIAWGDTWYGPEYMFGPNGNYMVLDEVNTVMSGCYFGYLFEHYWTRYSDFSYCSYETNPEG